MLSGWKAEVSISPNDADWDEKQQLQGSSHLPKAPSEHPGSRGARRVVKLPGGAGSQAELQEARARPGLWAGSQPRSPRVPSVRLLQPGCR